MIMDRCPLCRATLNGGTTCRRCRAELGSAQRAERDGRALADEAMRRLSLDDPRAALQLLEDALTLHAAPETLALWRMVTAESRRAIVVDVSETRSGGKSS
jgi:hypothetical protein